MNSNSYFLQGQEEILCFHTELTEGDVARERERERDRRMSAVTAVLSIPSSSWRACFRSVWTSRSSSSSSWSLATICSSFRQTCTTTPKRLHTDIHTHTQNYTSTRMAWCVVGPSYSLTFLPSYCLECACVFGRWLCLCFQLICM